MRKIDKEQKSLEEAMMYEEFALTELRGQGNRITMPRVQVIRALADAEKPMSAYAIHEKIINAGGRIDVVSVYRILITLQECGLVIKEGKSGGYLPLSVPTAAQNASFTSVKNYTEFGTSEAGYASENVLKTLQAENPDFRVVGVRIELELAPK